MGFFLQRVSNRSGACEDHIGLKFGQLFREGPHPAHIATGPTNIDLHIATVYPAQSR